MCDASSGEDADVDVNTGSNQDRVTVEVTAQYSPITKLIPIGTKTLVSFSARTILGLVEVGLAASSTPLATNTSGPATAVPSDTPIATVPTNTPTNTPTNSGPVYTLTPLPTNTPSLTPTITPTFTLTSTPTMTFTPTATSTPVPGCGNIIAGSISIPGASGNKSMSMTITNPHESITVLNVEVVWNANTGAPSDSLLTLKSASLGGTFWNGTDSSGSLTITPTSTVTIPGNNLTSTIIFTFDKNYQKKHNAESITINLSTPGCETFPIHKP